MKNFILRLFGFPAWVFNKINLSRKKVHKGKNLKINGKLYLRGRGKIQIGNNVVINSSFSSNSVGLAPHSSFSTFKNGNIIIGDQVKMSNVVISSRDKVVIEKDVLLGGGVQIFDSDFHSLKYAHRMESPDVNVGIRKVIIGEGAFIGTRAIILKGVSVGKRSIVGAGSVVSTNIPDDEIWGGNPAKFIKKIDQKIS